MGMLLQYCVYVPVLGLLLCLFGIVGVRSAKDDGDVESARCRVRCLAHLKHKLGAVRDNAGQSHITFEKCFQDVACTACLRPCGQPFISIGHCVQLCQEAVEDCEQSCRFLVHLRTTRPGSCMPMGDMVGFNAACVEDCAEDSDCDGSEKCCNNGCGYTCQEPYQPYIGVPDIPSVANVRERIRSGTVELSWRPVVSNNSAPILYIVQHRWNVGREYSDYQMTTWQQIKQTTATTTIIRDIGLGRWYEFRVGAVSVNGTRGFSHASEPFKLSKEPDNPSPPQNLTEGETVIKDGKISLTISWTPPKKSDLPVARYKVFWSKRMRSVSASLISLKEHRKVVSGEYTQHTFEDLDPDTTYFMQVQAISAYGDRRLKSQRASITITTFAFPQGPQDAPSIVEIKSLVTLPGIRNISISDSYFHNGLLKANLSWDNPPGFDPEVQKIILHWLPQVCIADTTGDGSVAKPMSATTHDTEFAIYDLRFDCRYVVKLQLVANDGQVGELAHITFSSPSCQHVNIIGDVLPDCPTNVPRVPEQPPSLEHSFLIINTNITARISWEPPPSDAPITSYRIIWGQTVQAQHILNPTMDQNTALTKVLPKEDTSFSIGNLQEAMSYMVRLQALSSAGSGKVASIIFTTPVLQPQPIAPPYENEGLRINDAEDTHHRTGTTSPSSPIQASRPAIPYGKEPQNTSSVSNQQLSYSVTLFTLLLNLMLLLRNCLPCR